MFNLHLLDASDCLGGVWPPVGPSEAVPKRLTTFYPKTAKDNPDAYCHFFIDDYRFERVWSNPERYVEVLKHYAGAIMPNFSTYHIMPLPMQWWNMYRNRMLAYYWQENGIDVVPLLQCGDPRTYDYAYEGLPIGGTHAVMNNGLVQDKENLFYFLEALEIALDAVKPDLLLVYGKKLDIKLPCEVIWYTNDNTNRLDVNMGRIQEPRPDRIDERGLVDIAEARMKALQEADKLDMLKPIGLSGDGYTRAVSTLDADERDPLMYNWQLEGWRPWYARLTENALQDSDVSALPEGSEQE